MDGSQPTLPPDIRRKRFTAADVQAMIVAGVIREGEGRVEFLEGELVEVSPQGTKHWTLTTALVRWFIRNLPETFGTASQGPLRLDDHNEPEPELFVYPLAIDVNDVRGSDVFLAVEVAVSSLRIDLKVKAPLYARHGVREYWVVDMEGRRTLVHKLAADGYGEPISVAFDVPLVAPAGLSLTIASLASKG